MSQLTAVWSATVVSAAPPAVIAIPAASNGRRGPRAPTIRPDSGAKTRDISAIGSSNPACNALKPRTSCR